MTIEVANKIDLGANIAIDDPLRLSRREAKKTANREAILASATEVFNEIGYEATNIRDIIRRTNLATGTFYNYFKTKEEVFDALQANAISRFKPVLREIHMSAKGDFEKFVETAYLGYFQFVVDNRPFAKNLDDNGIFAKARFDTPETLVMFAEIKNYILKYVAEDNFTTQDHEFLTASCIGIAQELSQCILRDKNSKLEDVARFATCVVLAGVNGLRSRVK